MKYEILGMRWYTPFMLPSVQLDMCIGIVAIRSGKGKEWKAYIGYGYGEDENHDAQLIASQGMPLGDAKVAAAYFPTLNEKDFKF